MKIIEQLPGSDKIIELQLSQDDLHVIDVIIPTPFGQMNEVAGLEWLNSEMVEQEKAYLIKHQNDLELNVEPGFLARLGFGFKACCEILDPCEMQTITNVEWEKAMELYGRLFHAAHSSSNDHVAANKLI